MHISSLGGYTAYILENDEDTLPDDLDPFNYMVLSIVEDDERTTKGICNNIPCDMCILQSDCNSGEFRHKTISEYFLTEFPELLI